MRASATFQGQALSQVPDLFALSYEAAVQLICSLCCVHRSLVSDETFERPQEGLAHEQASGNSLATPTAPFGWCLVLSVWLQNFAAGSSTRASCPLASLALAWAAVLVTFAPP